MKMKNYLILFFALFLYFTCYAQESPLGLRETEIYANGSVNVFVKESFAKDLNIIDEKVNKHLNTVTFDSIKSYIDGVLVYSSASVRFGYESDSTFARSFATWLSTINSEKNIYNLKISVKVGDNWYPNVYDGNLFYLHEEYVIQKFESDNKWIVLEDEGDKIYVAHDKSLVIECINRKSCESEPTFKCEEGTNPIKLIVDVTLSLNGEILKSKFPPYEIEHSIDLNPGINEIVFSAIDESGNQFSDSLKIFYIKNNSSNTFCRSSDYTLLDGIPEGGSFILKDMAGNVQEEGIVGNTNVFDPSGCESTIDEYWLIYNYPTILQNNTVFKDSIQITVGGQQASFNIDGVNEVCPFTEEQYTVYSEAEFDSALQYEWVVTGGEIIDNSSSSVTIRWGNVMNSRIDLTLSDPLTGCSSSIEKLVKVGSNASEEGNYVLEIDTSLVNSNTYLLACTQIEGANYLWFNSSEFIDTTTTNYLYIKGEGQYSVMIETLSNRGCSTMKSKNINIASRTTEINAKVFPNPFTDYINVMLPIGGNGAQKTKYQIYNSLGKLIRSGTLNEGLTEISSLELQAGVYLFELLTEKDRFSWTITK